MAAQVGIRSGALMDWIEFVMMMDGFIRLTAGAAPAAALPGGPPFDLAPDDEHSVQLVAPHWHGRATLAASPRSSSRTPAWSDHRRGTAGVRARGVAAGLRGVAAGTPIVAVVTREPSGFRIAGARQAAERGDAAV